MWDNVATWIEASTRELAAPSVKRSPLSAIYSIGW